MHEPRFLVKCIRGQEHAGLYEGQTYIVAVIVRDWTDSQGPHKGEAYVLFSREQPIYPYCFDSNRFETIG
jgi:hypothetical protein